MSSPMLIFKIFRAPEWEDLRARGMTQGAPVDVADGYIHFSTGAQVRETAAKWFAGVEGLVLAACDAAALGGSLKWEPSRGGALFPHLYRPLLISDILWTRPLPVGPGGHDFPPEVA